ncbi:MAG: bifunctional riboflavin kinase/FAD synthetase, partial [Gemmatimonadota bacterium]
MPDTRAPSPLPASIRRTVVTVGTFDGVHRGHWRVLQELRQRAGVEG